MPSSTKLREPIKLEDGCWLRTCKDAGEIILLLAKPRQHMSYWQHDAELLMRAVEYRGARADAHEQLVCALETDRMLAPPRPTRKKSEIRI